MFWSEMCWLRFEYGATNLDSFRTDQGGYRIRVACAGRETDSLELSGRGVELDPGRAEGEGVREHHPA